MVSCVYSGLLLLDPFRRDGKDGRGKRPLGHRGWDGIDGWGRGEVR